MYSKEEAAQLKREFWTTYGKYMLPVPSSEGGSQNWINYHTGIKHLYFRTKTEKKSIYIGIEILHPDETIRLMIYEQFLQLKKLLYAYLKEEWIWNENVKNEYGKWLSEIYTEKNDVTIYRKEHWQTIISFFKPRIIALDNFWNDVKDSFEIFK